MDEVAPLVKLELTIGQTNSLRRNCAASGKLQIAADHRKNTCNDRNVVVASQRTLTVFKKDDYSVNRNNIRADVQRGIHCSHTEAANTDVAIVDANGTVANDDLTVKEVICAAHAQQHRIAATVGDSELRGSQCQCAVLDGQLCAHLNRVVIRIHRQRTANQRQISCFHINAVIPGVDHKRAVCNDNALILAFNAVIVSRDLQHAIGDLHIIFDLNTSIVRLDHRLTADHDQIILGINAVTAGSDPERRVNQRHVGIGIETVIVIRNDLHRAIHHGQIIVRPDTVIHNVQNQLAIFKQSRSVHVKALAARIHLHGTTADCKRTPNLNAVIGSKDLQHTVAFHCQVLVYHDTVGLAIARKDRKIQQIFTLQAQRQRIGAVDTRIVLIGSVKHLIVFREEQITNAVIGKVMQGQYAVQEVRVATLGLHIGDRSVVVQILAVLQRDAANVKSRLSGFFFGILLGLHVGDRYRARIGHGFTVDDNDFGEDGRPLFLRRYFLPARALGS